MKYTGYVKKVHKVILTGSGDKMADGRLAIIGCTGIVPTNWDASINCCG